MATHGEIEKRVERFLQGRRDVANLDRIFLWLRTRSFGVEAIRDLGDFVAHSDERIMGKAWKHSGDTFTGLRHALNLITKGHGTKESLVAGLRANLRLATPSDTKKQLGIGQNAARRIVEGLIQKIEAFDGRQLTFKGYVSPSETRVFNYYHTRVHVKPAHTQQTLLDDFVDVLSRNNLIVSGENRVAAVGDYLAVYAISKMHMCEITYEDAPPIALRAGWQGVEDGPLSVSAASESVDGIWVAVPMFQTECIAKDWCTKKLLQNQLALGKPIELSIRWKLRPVA